MTKIKRIFIVGHSGAGKGLLAKAVAKKLDWKFIDADFALAPSIGRDITEIIGKPGEIAFQDCLADILLYQTYQDYIVVTTDDSIVCSEKNRKLLASEFVVYLKVSTQVQMERMAYNRPLLPTARYEAFLNKLHHQRDDFYAQVASLRLNSDQDALEAHVFSVVNAVKK